MTTTSIIKLLDDREFKLLYLPQQMKDNTKLAIKQQWMKDYVKVSNLQQVKLSELQHWMKDNAAKIAEEVMSICEKIKKFDTFNRMIKESTLDKLLVGRGALDQLLAEEEAEWQKPRTSKLRVQPLSKRMRYCGELVMSDSPVTRTGFLNMCARKIRFNNGGNITMTQGHDEATVINNCRVNGFGQPIMIDSTAIWFVVTLIARIVDNNVKTLLNKLPASI
jgi:hypothetical protein